MTLQRYLENRRWWEIGMVLSFALVGFLANVGLEVIERGRGGTAVDWLEPVVLEGTSHVAMIALFPLVLWFDHRNTIGVNNWRRTVRAHALFSVAFSLAHVTLMYWGRVLVFSASSSLGTYHWEHWLTEFGYEYLKDFRAYLLIIVIVYLYRFVLRRLQGEAGFLDEPQDETPTTGVPDRFLVKKLGREFLVRIDEIDWIESSGNYVNLHVGNRVYPLRETMTRIDERLLPLGFQRVHRSAIVNLDRVAEIVAFDTGDGEARLRTDARVPVSRRFRQELKARLV
ncbi:MAG: LytTR family transcriptional regulator [Gammaproteobacteria bacterium]|nr:LytTR family transcriptional regulator [Gammaproteobacteria bacterium]MDH5617430.1 LytTR family transcriptional regulator [Gammaproteobacteria bacterium]